jgi:hypothetical protein
METPAYSNYAKLIDGLENPSDSALFRYQKIILIFDGIPKQQAHV